MQNLAERSNPFKSNGTADRENKDENGKEKIENRKGTTAERGGFPIFSFLFSIFDVQGVAR